MAQRGRKPPEDLSTVAIAPKLRKPAAPEHLTDAEKTLWRSVVAALPADWFSRETLPILTEYVRHSIRADRLSEALKHAPDDVFETAEKLDHWSKLARLAETETRAMITCARSLRITHQARYDAAKAARRSNDAPKGPKPWETPIRPSEGASSATE